MIELSRHDDGQVDMKFAGDTLNALVYLAREADATITPCYMTALGDDPFSQAMIRQWQLEGIETRYVQRLDGQLPGLYIIDNDQRGEKRVFYWRANAAVRQLFRRDDALLECLEDFGLIYVSGISLAVLPAPQRDRLMARLSDLRGRVRIAFDPNYRTALWPEPDHARILFERMYALTDFLLVSNEDAERCYAGTDVLAAIDSAGAMLDFFCRRCAGEIVLRRGAQSCLIHDGGRHEIAALSVRQIDTTGAGDAFNGTYLACRLRGLAAVEAAQRAHRVAAMVVRTKGAIVPR